jgi:Ser-tRNA(Ala) deacylase AlaX
MSKLVAIKIDVSKIDKARLFQGKNGAQYLDATVFINEEAGQYGDHGMITQSVSKEEREAGVKGAILGNVKTLGEFGDNKPATAAVSDDIPF